MKAKLSQYRQAPRKVRLVTDLIKGKSVESAMSELSYLPKRAAGPILKLLKSAVANAGKVDNLYIKSIGVDKGVVLKRSMPRAHGRAFPIHKHTSHITIELAVRSKTKH
ncbi:MAG TPA: 50S ribosomal protein L22 [Candidatus Paceibacterota bacterium]